MKQNINLLHTSLQHQSYAASKKIIKTTVAVLVIASILISVLTLYINVQRKESLLADVQQELADKQTLKNEIKEEMNKLSDINSLNDTVTHLEENRHNKLREIKKLESLTPSEVDIETISVSDQRISIQGSSPTRANISELLQNLYSWQGYKFTVSYIAPQGQSYGFNIEGRGSGDE
ncbi:PilN domain-containing protein [Proteinivorax hydrogeniformans]|uniref:PilN domain-containing protein n=1 Tax=Proteinivorax hydrogeniformans TaxID=1826727 RepID=A0AAU8HS55_9FIRM